MPKDFHISDVLSITDGRLLSVNGMDGLYKILDYMTDEKLFTHQLPRASKVCAPAILQQHPILQSGEMQFALGELTAMLASTLDDDKERLILGWLSKLTSGKYGIDVPEFLVISPITNYERKNPLTELAEMVPEEKIIPVILSQ